MIRIHWENALANNIYHYIITRMLCEKHNIKMSYVDSSRYPRTNDPKKMHAGVLVDPIEHLKNLGLSIDYYPENKNKVKLTHVSQLSNISNKKNIEYVLERKSSWNFFNREDVIKNIDNIKKWFYPIEKSNFKDVVIHARLGQDWYRKNRVPEFSKIENFLKQIDFEKIYICTDVPEDKFINNFKDYNYEVISTHTRHCDPKTGYFLNEADSKTIVKDFNLIRSFDKIILTSPRSTFSFLSAALSNANTVKYDKEEAKSLTKKWFITELFEK